MSRTSFQKHNGVPVVSLFACLIALAAMRTGATADDAAMVQPLVAESTLIVCKIDPTRLALPNLKKPFESAAPESERASREWARQVEQGLDTCRAATGGQPIYATVAFPQDKQILVFIKETPKVNRKAFSAALGAAHPRSSCVRDGRIVTVLRRNEDVQAALDALVPQPRNGLGEAFKAVANYPIQILLLPPDHLRRTLVELMPQLPRFLGGGPSRLLTEGLVWAAVGIDPKKLEAELIVQSASPEAARNLADHFPKMLRGIRDAVPETESHILEAADTLLPRITPHVDGDRVIVRLGGQESVVVSAQLIGTTIVALFDRYHLGGNSDQFKEILLGMHNYYDTYKMLPPRDGVRDKDGNPGLSWRVHILPFVEEQKLYEQFHLDEPWDSPHNKKLIEKMPARVYGSQRPGIKRGYTTFLAPAGNDAVFGGKKATHFYQITDGTSNTIGLVEVKPELAVPWTAPEDYQFAPKAPARGLRIRANGGFLVALVDGSVHLLPSDLAPESLLHLFQKSDGNVVQWK